jgi:hypothetical protein
MPVVKALTGEVREAAIFIAVLGASNYPFAEATWSQSLPDWIGSHVRAFAAFHRRGGALKSPDLLRGPCVPVFKGLRRKPQREHMVVKRTFAGLPGLSEFGFPARAARASYLVFPIDPWKEDLLGPYPPWRGESSLLHILPNAFPPKIHEGGQGRQLLADLFHGVVLGGALMVLG